MTGTARAAVAAIYAQVSAPDWAAPNLDGLADVLRDLSWLPPGPVAVTVPSADAEGRHDADHDGDRDADHGALRAVLARAVDETIATDRPVRLR